MPKGMIYTYTCKTYKIYRPKPVKDEPKKRTKPKRRVRKLGKGFGE